MSASSRDAGSYGKTIGGALSLKGLGTIKAKKKDKKKKKHKKHKKSRKRGRDELDTGKKEEEEEEVVLMQKRGTGRIVTSGTTVHGKETKFMDELHIGDAIMVSHPTSLQEETRIVKMVLSNVSISISSPFSSDLITSARFHYVKKPKSSTELASEQQRASAKRQRKKEDEEKLAFGTYAGRKTFTYRVRKASAYGGYKIVTETLDDNGSGGLTRGQLLDMRSKKKADRMCM